MALGTPPWRDQCLKDAVARREPSRTTSKNWPSGIAANHVTIAPRLQRVGAVPHDRAGPAARVSEQKPECASELRDSKAESPFVRVALVKVWAPRSRARWRSPWLREKESAEDARPSRASPGPRCLAGLGAVRIRERAVSRGLDRPAHDGGPVLRRARRRRGMRACRAPTVCLGRRSSPR